MGVDGSGHIAGASGTPPPTTVGADSISARKYSGGGKLMRAEQSPAPTPQSAKIGNNVLRKLQNRAIIQLLSLHIHTILHIFAGGTRICAYPSVKLPKTCAKVENPLAVLPLANCIKECIICSIE